LENEHQIYKSINNIGLFKEHSLQSRIALDEEFAELLGSKLVMILNSHFPVIEINSLSKISTENATLIKAKVVCNLLVSLIPLFLGNRCHPGEDQESFYRFSSEKNVKSI
jgi:hypothetical protein